MTGKFRILVLTLINIIIILFASSPILGCVGSRPLGMGGAFIGVADNIETVYWNPAGLRQINQESLHFTLTLNKRDQMGYRSFIAFNKNFDNISTGFSYISRLRSWNVLEEWYVVSIASEIYPGFSVGLNGRYEIHSNGFSDKQLDISALCNISERFKVGFLYQSLNNFRPGCSYQLNNNIIISVDIYNALHNIDILAGEHRIMWGIEFKQDEFGIRLGQYAGDLTFGVSYKNLDLAVMNRKDTIFLLGFNL